MQARGVDEGDGDGSVSAAASVHGDGGVVMLSLRSSGTHLLAAGVHACATNTLSSPITLQVLQVCVFVGVWAWWMGPIVQCKPATA